MMWLILLNVFCLGYSGVSLNSVLQIISILNCGILACVPSRGSVGASGDLAPSAHAVLPLIENTLCSIFENGKTQYLPSFEILRKNGLQSLSLGPKEGLSLINGLQLSISLAIKAHLQSKSLLDLANLVAALSIHAANCSNKIFRQDVLATHGQSGVSKIGNIIAELLDLGSNDYALGSKVQDPYSFRCIPQIHGSVYDALEDAEAKLLNELQTAHDNPLVYVETNDVVSCGNFHGIYVAKIIDTLFLNIISIATCSERRINQFMNFSERGLPVFLIKNPGLNSGMMMLQTTAAALLNEAKSLADPASIDNIPTNCDQEDHVSMAPGAAYKLLRLIELIKEILAIELLVACQAADFNDISDMPPKLYEIYSAVRLHVDYMPSDTVIARGLEKVLKIIESKFGRLRNIDFIKASEIGSIYL